MAGQYEAVQFTPQGVAGVFGLYTTPGASLRDTFMNEFFAVSYSFDVLYYDEILILFLIGFLPWVRSPNIHRPQASNADDIPFYLLSMVIWLVRLRPINSSQLITKHKTTGALWIPQTSSFPLLLPLGSLVSLSEYLAIAHT